jgi:hypothetical protein
VRRRIAAAALLAASLLPLAPSPTGAIYRPGPCPLLQGADESVRHYEKRLITCAAERWPVKGGAARAICIADRESNLIPTAVGHGEKDDYLGLFQHAATYWPWRFTTYTRVSWQLSDHALSGRSNAIVTIRMVAAAGSWKAAGWPRWDC